MSDITFEAKDGQGFTRTWRYKDRPRRIQPGEYYFNSTSELVSLSGGTKQEYVPVEPVEPAEVVLRLGTTHVKDMLKHDYFWGYEDNIRRQLREQGVDV